ncbi:hypothetical protein KQI82_08880 [Oscillibacter sp. MSJ-2]|uniref:UGSC-like domain-containing protein n=1 Tax=Dysosmobacter acutus TaxID=2841504 RepID=A0ABS6F9P4_9FIRM|nr:hypothetical protein [Dysosmobacter acutus]MBU5627019.1 hypothetical protein [Dysosmobacter acutus]
MSYAETCGIPSTAMIITGFIPQAKLVAASQGFPDLPISEYPDTMMTDSDEELREKVVGVLCDNVVRSLTQTPPPRKPRKKREPNLRDIIFEGSISEVNEFFYENLWTDGLPIIPPTLEEVDRFMEFTSRPADEVIAKLPHENRKATVWSVAVNGVMAGCRPEYMPLLLAAVEAISYTGIPGNLLDQGWRAEDTGTSPGWEPLIIVSGPLVKKLDFNCGQGALRFGRQANTSFGRFLKLFLRNVGGFRIPPGSGDKGSLGQSMNVAIAENQDFVQELGWKTYQEERGFSAEDTCVTVLSSAYVSAPCYTSGDEPEQHLEILSEEICEKQFGIFSTWGVHTFRLEPVLMLAPPVAQIFAEHGLSKQDVRDYLYRNSHVTAGQMERHWHDFNGLDFDMYARAKNGKIPPVYGESNDPQRPIPVFLNNKTLQIIVAGDPARAQSKGFMQSGYIAPATSRKVCLPENYDELIAKQKERT